MRENLHVHYSADLYDHYTASFVQAYDDAFLKQLLKERYRLPETDAILVDIGTGTAQFLIRLAQLPEFDGIRLIGTDYFQDMVDVALAAVQKSNLGDRIEIEQADVHAMPYTDGSVDAIISRSTIHHWSDPVGAFREIDRILKPGGIAIIHEPRRDPAPEVLAEFNRQREQAGVEPVRLEEKYTAAEVREFLDRAGVDSQTSQIDAPERGLGALGMEVRIIK